MKRILLLISMVLLSCSSDNGSNEEEQNSQDPIIGDWIIIESGGALANGDTFSDSNPCSNTQRHRFFEDGTLEAEIWWDNAGVCTFDQDRPGQWFKSTTNVNPDANYRLVYNQIPSDAEEVGFPEITFSGNTMRIEYAQSGTFQYTYRTYRKQ